MNINNKFDISKLKGKLSNIRDWMKEHHFPPKMLFFILGILSTLWFLIRGIPKPSRAGYPCMKVAAPFMSGFIVYLLSLGGITLALRKAKQNIINARYVAAASLILVALAGLVISLTHGIQNSYAGRLALTGPDDGPNQTIQISGIGFTVNFFYSALVDNDNIKWFLTDKGIVSFDGKKWTIHNKNRKVTTENLKGFAYEVSSYGPEIWIATPTGATVASLPVDARSGATTYHTENSAIMSDNVRSVAIGKGHLRWFGTDKGISAFNNKKWLTNSYQKKYPVNLFQASPVTVLATSPEGDTLYVGTEGSGVARVFRNDVDAISGASEYAQWGPILLPSDNIYSILITQDGTQWFGTDQGIARHTGNITMEKWSVFTTKEGLVHNFVQAIAIDKKGNTWFGTKGGVSVFDGSSWISFTEKDGLVSDNVLCITVDREGIVWLGTDNGVTSYNSGKFTSYR